MPRILRIGPYQFFSYGHEPNEPVHIHIDRGNLSAKFWIENPSLARNFGYPEKELNSLQQLVEENQQFILEAWHEYFGS